MWTKKNLGQQHFMHLDNQSYYAKKDHTPINTSANILLSLRESVLLTKIPNTSK